MTDEIKGLVERLKESADAFRKHPIFTADGDPVFLKVQADELTEAAAALTLSDEARVRAEGERDAWRETANGHREDAERFNRERQASEALVRELVEGLNGIAADEYGDTHRELAQALILRAGNQETGSSQSQPVLASNGHTDAEPSATFQARVLPWMLECFGPVIPFDKEERGDRLLEETFETLQSGGYDPRRVAALRDYVWGRPVGEPSQEVGGVMVTLAAYCIAHDIDMAEAGETELARIWTKVPQIRAKQAAKPTGSALPVAPRPDCSAAQSLDGGEG